VAKSIVKFDILLATDAVVKRSKSIVKFDILLATDALAKSIVKFDILLATDTVAKSIVTFDILLATDAGAKSIEKFQWRNYYGLRPGEPGGPQTQWAKSLKWGPPALGDRAKTLARASDMLQCRFLTIKIL
jgi:hypothetical protein